MDSQLSSAQQLLFLQQENAKLTQTLIELTEANEQLNQQLQQQIEHIQTLLKKNIQLQKQIVELSTWNKTHHPQEPIINTPIPPPSLPSQQEINSLQFYDYQTPPAKRQKQEIKKKYNYQGYFYQQCKKQAGH